MFSKKFLIPVLAVTVSGATIFGISQAVHAQSGNTFYSGLVQAISQKFNLDQNQVQSVFDQYKQQHKTDMQQNMTQRLNDRLTQAVQQGKITDSQKQAILDELTTLKSKYNLDSLQNMTPDQRHQAFQNMQSDFKSWAQSQGIDLSILPGLGRGMRMHRWGWINPTVTPTPTP